MGWVWLLLRQADTEEEHTSSGGNFFASNLHAHHCELCSPLVALSFGVARRGIEVEMTPSRDYD